MMDLLYSFDLAIFYFFNHTISTGFLDKFFSIITDVTKWYIAYAILLIIVTDQTGYRLLKETIERVRPCNALSDVLTPIGCSGGFSFPSNHALNNFAAAVFLLRLFPNYKWVFLIVATLVSMSRIYLGVHYPSDVVGGALIGAGFGYLFSIAALKAEDYFLKRSPKS
ncbi:MAG: phosphatase PAP2 family protein [Chlorobiota bacterium]|nr:MAG: phosphatase PAP2 family protein [Chlorobiota bacterium]